MKLRLDERSVRLRLGRSDVDRLRREGRVEVRVPLDAGGGTLAYAVEIAEASPGAPASPGPAGAPSPDLRPPAEARLEEGTLVIHLPPSVAREWTETDRVGIEAEQEVADGPPLRILIEKDFPCRHGPEGSASDPDRFGELAPG